MFHPLSAPVRALLVKAFSSLAGARGSISLVVDYPRIFDNKRNAPAPQAPAVGRAEMHLRCLENEEGCWRHTRKARWVMMKTMTMVVGTGDGADGDVPATSDVMLRVTL